MASWPWKPGVDAREVASRTSTPEAFVILSGIALLAEAPADPSDPSYPMAVTVNGSPRTRVTGTPAAGQFRVRMWTSSPVGPEWLPELEFNAADEGLSGTCDYYRTGTIWTWRRMQSFQAFMDPLTAVPDQATLNTIAPPSSSRDAPGRDGRTARLADGSWWESDGTQWKPWVGGGKLYAQALAGASLSIVQDSNYTPPGGSAVADRSDGSTLGVSADAAFDLPAGFTGSSTLGATVDAVWASGAISFPYTDDYSTDRLASQYLIPAGSWNVTSGKLHCQSSSGVESAALVNATSPTDGYVEAVLTIGNSTTNYIALLARYGDANNLLKAYIELSTNKIWLGQYVTGSWSNISVGYQDVTNLVVGTANTVRLTYSGTSVSVQLNGTTRISGTTTRTAGGKAGLGANLGTAGDAQFDNLSIT